MAQDYESKAKVLMMQEDGWIRLSTIARGESLGGSSGPCNPEGLRTYGKHQARLLYNRKIYFGEYQTLNGRDHDIIKTEIVCEPSKRVDAKTLSIINFAILNEMMRLTSQGNLEEKAA